eukprot:Gb_02668 [translate_table: standard]
MECLPALEMRRVESKLEKLSISKFIDKNVKTAFVQMLENVPKWKDGESDIAWEQLECKWLCFSFQELLHAGFGLVCNTLYIQGGAVKMCSGLGWDSSPRIQNPICFFFHYVGVVYEGEAIIKGDDGFSRLAKVQGEF